MSTDNGTSWAQKTVTGVTDNLRALSFVSGGQTGWVVGSNGTVAQWSGTLFVSVEEKHPAELPSSCKLSQNYPNPFNPTTQIRYRISDIGYLKLSVFDILGREVAVLVNEKKAPGSYEVKFDGSNLASGVYLYRLKAGSFVETRRLCLIK